MGWPSGVYILGGENWVVWGGLVVCTWRGKLGGVYMVHGGENWVGVGWPSGVYMEGKTG